ncbi:hypothetical protein KY284_036146 [Solanum tuberosum]|nr:hypothetical protein KY284_036146 [Solanum tuberosum]
MTYSVFYNGNEHQFDAIIFAIGYKNVATKWLKIVNPCSSKPNCSSPSIIRIYVVITTLARVGGASFWQLAKFHHAGAIAYPNALAPDLTAGFSLSFLACYAPTSGMLYQMRQPISGVGATCANSN